MGSQVNHWTRTYRNKDQELKLLQTFYYYNFHSVRIGIIFLPQTVYVQTDNIGDISFEDIWLLPKIDPYGNKF